MQAEDMGGSEYVFEDVSEGQVWEHEQRIAAQPLDFKSACAAHMMHRSASCSAPLLISLFP
jgi:hypothetical protein